MYFFILLLNSEQSKLYWINKGFISVLILANYVYLVLSFENSIVFPCIIVFLFIEKMYNIILL